MKLYEHLPELTNEQLTQAVHEIPVNYPDASQKLCLSSAQWAEIASNGFVLPIGEWTLDNHRRPEDIGVDGVQPIYTAEHPAPPEDTERWRRAGLHIDESTGLAIHPYAKQLFTTIGMFTQVGSFYRPGPNEVVNTAISRERNGVKEYACVAVQRSKPRESADQQPATQTYWSLPGGFFDLGKDAGVLAGAQRELREETGLSLDDIEDFLLRRYEDIPQYNWAATAVAWMQERYFFVRSLSNIALEGLEDLVPQDRKEIVDVAWLSRPQMDNPELRFIGPHKRKVDQFEQHLASGVKNE